MNLLIVDGDPAYVRSVTTSVRQHFENVEVWTTPKMDGALDDYLPAFAEKNPGVLEKIRKLNKAGKSVRFTMDVKSGDFDLLKIDSSAKSILGFPKTKFEESPSFWRGLLEISQRAKFNRWLSDFAKSPGTPRKSDEFVFLDGQHNRYESDLEISSTGSAYRVVVDLRKVEPLATEAANQLLSPAIDLLVVSLDGVPAPARALGHLGQELEAFNGKFGRQRPMIFATAHEGSALSIRALVLDDGAPAEDLLMKPFDELLFLQKLKSRLPGLRTRSEGHFLFTLRERISMELAGEYQATEISPSGFRIKHRGTLKQLQRIKFQMPERKAQLSEGVYGVCFDTQSDKEGGFLSNFWYVAMRPDSLRQIRQEVGDSLKAKGSRSGVRAPPNWKYQLEAQAIKALVIDLDPRTVETVRGVAQEFVAGLDVVGVSSLHDLMQTLAPEAASSGSESEARPREWADKDPFFPSPQPRLRFNPEKGDFLGFHDAAGGSGEFCGHDRQVLSASVSAWRRFVHPDEQTHFSEYISFCASGQLVNREVRFVTADRRVVAARLQPTLGGTMEQPEIILACRNITDELRSAGRLATDRLQTTSSLLGTVVVLIDMSFIQSDPVAHLDRLVTELQRAAMVDRVSVLLLSQQVLPDKFLADPQKKFDDILYKPLDRAHMGQRFRQLLGRVLGLSDDSQDPQVISSQETVLMPKSVQVSSIGEYGCEIETPVALPVGAWGHLLFAELGLPAGSGLVAKCIGHEIVEARKVRNRFVFPGLNEERLKALRLFLKKRALTKTSQL